MLKLRDGKRAREKERQIDRLTESETEGATGKMLLDLSFILAVKERYIPRSKC